jgi:hypothetical protein
MLKRTLLCLGMATLLFGSYAPDGWSQAREKSDRERTGRGIRSHEYEASRPPPDRTTTGTQEPRGETVQERPPKGPVNPNKSGGAQHRNEED